MKVGDKLIVRRNIEVEFSVSGVIEDEDFKIEPLILFKKGQVVEITHKKIINETYFYICNFDNLPFSEEQIRLWFITERQLRKLKLERLGKL